MLRTVIFRNKITSEALKAEASTATYFERRSATLLAMEQQHD
jgi:hypothetical protein